MKILYCLLFLKTEEEEFCNYLDQTSTVYTYIFTNITEFLLLQDENFHTVVPKNSQVILV